METTKPKIIIELGGRKVDVVKIIENYCYIIDKDSNFIHLILNKPQTKLLSLMADDWNNNRPLRYIILKARQMGFSTVIEAFIFVVTLFQQNQRSAIVADCAENASSLFDMSKLYYDSLTDGLKEQIPLKNKSGKLLSTLHSNSSIRVLCASDNTGRSKSLQWIHASEFAFWQSPESTLTSLLRTISASNPKSGIFIESTANGFNAFKRRWDKAVSGNQYRAVFFAWWEMDSYRLDYIFDESPHTPEEEDLIKKYNLDEAQIQWRRYQIADMNGDVSMFNQEYPACPTDAFVSTGFSVFDNQEISKRKEEVVNDKGEKGYFAYDKRYSLDGSKITISNIRWVKAPYGEITIYRNPIPNFPYVLGGDPANGGADSFVGQCINNVNKEQVAIYRKVGVDPDLYAFQLYCLGKHFNNALIGTETNITGSVMKTLAKCGYPNLYIRETVDKTNVDYQNAYGVKTTPITKPIMVDTFKAIFRENPKVINDYLTLCEMETFEVVDTPGNNNKQTTRGANGEHDDTVMAMCIAYYISAQQTTYVNNSVKSESIDNWIQRSIQAAKKGNGYNLWKN